MHSISRAPAQAPSDEIDLLALCRSVWNKRWWVAGITLAATGLAALYAYTSTPIYQTQVVLRPAHVQDLDTLNATGLYELKPEKALEQVGAELESYGNRWAFFQASPSLFEGLARPGQSLEQTFNNFNSKAFTPLHPSKRDAETASGTYVGLRFEYPSTIDGVTILNGMVTDVLAREQSRVAAELSVLIDNRVTQLTREIDAARTSYQVQVDAEIARLTEEDAVRRTLLQDELTALRQELKVRRENRIAELDEAMRIATALGITRPTTPSALSQDQGRGGGGSVIRTEINNQQIPLYFMGAQALKAERDALAARESDDFVEPRIAQIAKELDLLQRNRRAEALQARENSDLFITDIAKMQGELARLHGLRLDLGDLQLVRVDQPAVQPLSPVKPRKALIMALGLVLGLMLGVFVALVLGLFQKQQAVTFVPIDGRPQPGSKPEAAA